MPHYSHGNELVESMGRIAMWSYKLFAGLLMALMIYLGGYEMRTFEKALDRVLIAEGYDRFTNHPQDRGGPTKWGVTQARYAEFLGRAASIDDVRAMPKEHAVEIYKIYYWDAMNLDLIKSEILAMILFDQGVNRGPVTAMRSLQATLNRDFGKTVSEDGKLGPITVEAIESVDELDLKFKYLQAAQLAYASIVANNPTQSVFIRGWMNRTFHLWDLVLEKAKLCVDAGTAPLPVEQQPDVSGVTAFIAKLIEWLAGFLGKPSEDIVEDPVLPEVPNDKPFASKYKFAYDFMVKDGMHEDQVLRFVDYWAHETNANYSYAINFDKRCSEQRIYLFSLRDQTVTTETTTHGSGSDRNNTGYATSFSNVSGSHQSSLGLLKTAETYIGGNGRSLRLDGLDPSNSLNRPRLIVFHGANYARTCGRSQGCPCVHHNVAQQWIDKLKGGSPGFHYHKSMT